MKDFFSLLLQKENGCFCIPKSEASSFLHELTASPFLSFVFSGKLFTVQDVEEIKKTLTFSHEGKKGLVVFIDFYTYGVEAQNALLKTLEELPVGVYIVFTEKSEKDLLSTILSRSIRFHKRSNSTKNEHSSSILEMSPVIRRSHKEVKRILKKHENDDESFKEDLDILLASLIEESYRTRVKTHTDSESIKKCIEVYDFLKQRGSTPKNILEYILLTLP
jgi:DNA polymerase III delta prime subunit